MSILVNMPEGEVRVEDGVELMAVTSSIEGNLCKYCYFAQGKWTNERCPEVTHFSEGTHTICSEQVQNGRKIFFLRPEDYAVLRLKGRV